MDKSFSISDRRIPELCPSAVWEYCPDTGRIAWGKPSAEVFGQPQQTLSTLADLIQTLAPEDQSAFADKINFSLKQNEPVNFESRTALSGPNRRWLYTFAFTSANAEGQPSLHAITTDISELRLAQFAAQEADEKYHFLTDALPIYIWTGEGTTFEYCNRHLLEFTGLSMAQIQAGASFLLVHPDDHDRLVQNTLHSLQTGEPLTQEYRIRATNGEYRWHLAHSDQFTDVHGRRKWVGIAIDITDRKTAEEELKNANQRLSLALTTAQMGDWEWIIDEGRVHWSEMVSRMHGFKPEEFDGRFESWIATVHPDDRDSVLQAVTKAINGDADYDVEYRSVRRDGSTYWTLARAVMVRHPDGKPQRLMGVCMDITSRKQAEQAMQRSEKLAAVGRLAASIAHEINNPLESVTNLLFLVANHKDLPASLHEYLHTAQSELARVSQITTQTLRFYRQSSSPAVTDVSALIDSVLSLYQGRLNGANVEVVRQYRVPSPILCLEGELRQAVTNLVGNALDSMVNRGGRLVIRSRMVPGASGNLTVRISIADTGIGILPEVRQRLFQPFFTTKPTGTGLGLWITYELIRKQGGTISVRSKPGFGTVFSITLPATITGD